MKSTFSQPGRSARELRRAAQRTADKKPSVDANAVSQPQLSSRPAHAEAFCLMWYACACGHRERIWNSRDGVTPFGFACPSCKEPKLQHVDFRLDTYAPNHRPAAGQRIWVDMTRERARTIAQRTIEQVAKSRAIPAHDFERIAEAVYNGGAAPDLVIWGYVEAP